MTNLADKQLQINKLLREGYAYQVSNRVVEACNGWLQAWEQIVQLAENQSLEALDQQWDPKFTLYNWAPDLEMVLGHVALEDIEYARKRIKFCDDYLKYVEDKEDLNSLNMVLAKADSYFTLGEEEKGEKIYQQFVQEHPTLGVGWVAWADQYLLLYQEDYAKAMAILKQGLTVDGLEDRAELLWTLAEIYKSMGEFELEKEVRQEINTIAPETSDSPVVEPKQVPIRVEKVGRNDPCPCGSGKKYKKCCLK